jgi:hypothetical protein
VEAADQAPAVDGDPDALLFAAVDGDGEDDRSRGADSDRVEAQVLDTGEAGVQRRRGRCWKRSEIGAVEVGGDRTVGDWQVRHRCDEPARLPARGGVRKAYAGLR